MQHISGNFFQCSHTTKSAFSSSFCLSFHRNFNGTNMVHGGLIYIQGGITYKIIHYCLIQNEKQWIWHSHTTPMETFMFEKHEHHSMRQNLETIHFCLLQHEKEADLSTLQYNYGNTVGKRASIGYYWNSLILVHVYIIQKIFCDL